MKQNKLFFYAGIAISALALPLTATAQNQDAATNAVGDWDDTASWTGGTLPTATSGIALIRSGTQVLDIDSGTGAVEINRVTLGQSGSTATLNIQSGGSLSIINGGGSGPGQFRLGGGGAGGTTSVLNVESGGTFSALTLQTSNMQESGDVSTANFNGGSISVNNLAFTNTIGSATLNVNGGGGSFTVANTAEFGDFATLAFALDGTGAASITALSADTITIGTASLLSIDLSSYLYSGSGTDTVTLASATTNFTSGFDLGNISFIDGSGFTTSIDQTLGAGGSIILNIAPIPEPSAYAMLAGLAGLTLVSMRRRRA